MIFLLLLVICFKDVNLQEVIPRQPKFNSTECFYCSQASIWIMGLSEGFPAFNNNTFNAYVQDVQDATCDTYDYGYGSDCYNTAGYAAIAAYHNWDAVCHGGGWAEKICNDYMEFWCTFQEEFPFCDAYDLFCTMVKQCSFIPIPLLCPGPFSACEICTHYFGCPSEITCQGNVAPLCI